MEFPPGTPVPTRVSSGATRGVPPSRRLVPRFALLLGITALLVGCVLFAGAALRRWATREMLTRQSHTQLMAASQQAAWVSDKLSHIQVELDTATRHPAILAGTEDAIRPVLARLYENHADLLVCVSYQDSDGAIRFAEGQDRSGEGCSIRDQPHMRRLFSVGKPVVSGSFMAVEGYYAVSLHVPVFRDNRVDGSVGAMVKWDTFAHLFQRMRGAGDAICLLLDTTGRIVYSSRGAQVGLHMAELPAILLGGSPLAPAALYQSRSTLADGPFFGDTRVFLTTVPVTVGTENYALLTATPYADAAGPLFEFMRATVLLLGLVLLIIAVALVCVFHLFYADKRSMERLHAELAGEVAERRHTEQTLREREAFSRALFEHNPLETIVVDREGRIVRTNMTQQSTRGRLPALGDRMYVEYAGKHQIDMRAQLMDAIESGRSKEFPELQYGSRFLAITISPFPEGAIIISKDVTEQRRLKEQVLQGAKLEAIGQLAGGIAHDFNNQLSGIMGYADILRAHVTGNATLYRYADMIVQAAGRCSDLTGQLLAFARKGKYLSVPVDLHKVISEVLSLLRHTIDKRILLRQELHAERSVTVGDPTQLQNALLNIAINARDAMPDGGVLTFGTRDVTLDEAQCRRQRYEISPGPFVEVSIADTGTGMDAEIQKHIFEPFFTTKKNGMGTGMGLAAVHGTVKIHHGAVAVNSRPGHGTVFKIYLPLSQDAEPASEAVEQVTAAPAAATVLVVDDEDTVRRMARDMLVELGYRVLTAANGREALALFRDQARKIHLIVLDLVMPEMSGRDTFRALRALQPDVRIILSSGYSVGGEAQVLLNEGAVHFIHKPFRVAELSRAIAEALKVAPGGGP